MPKPAIQNIIDALAQFSIVLPNGITVNDCYGHMHNDSRAIADGDIFLRYYWSRSRWSTIQ